VREALELWREAYEIVIMELMKDKRRALKSCAAGEKRMEL